jgi:UDP-2,3-diacylglucosamine hydrolase
MGQRPFFVVSDLHLGAIPVERERAFREFLRFASTTASGLLINGDLFDVWMASRHFVVRHHVRVLAAIADVVEAGVPVFIVGGNHDALEFGGRALSDLGARLLVEPARLQLGAWRALVIHGDGVQRSGLPYPHYAKRHALLRSGAFRWSVERLMHLDRIYDRVARWSKTKAQVERRLRGDARENRPDASPIEAWAVAALEREPDRDIVLAGHSHLPVVREVGDGRFYVNSGDWVSHMTVCVLPADANAPYLMQWSDCPQQPWHA